jgi:hypothetical protein
MTSLRFARDLAIAALVGTILGLSLASLGGCTPAHRDLVAQHSTTAAKFAACGMNVLAELEAERLRAVREEERRAEEEAANIDDAAREHPPSVKEEIEKVMR